MICDDCILSEHKDHRWVKLRDYGGKHERHLTEDISQASTKVSEIREVVDKAKQDFQSFKTDMEGHRKSITKRKKDIEDIISLVTRDLLELVDKEEKTSSTLFGNFVTRQNDRVTKLNQIISVLKEKNLEKDDFVRCSIILNEIVQGDPYTDVPPNFEGIAHVFNEDCNAKTYIQKLMGSVISSNNANAVINQETYDSMAELVNTDSYLQQMVYDEGNFEVRHTFHVQLDGPIKYISTYADGHAAILGNERLLRVHLENEKTSINLLTTLREVPVAVAVNINKILFVATTTHLMQLIKTTAFITKQPPYKLNPGIDIDHLKPHCLCMTGPYLTVCGQLQNTALHENQFELWDFDTTSKRRTAIKRSFYFTEDDAIKIISICKDRNQRLCLVCQTDKYSWVQVLNKNLEIIYKYPKNYKHIDDYRVVGAGFLSNGNVTVCCRVHQQQHLIDEVGSCRWKRKLNNKPVCCVVDEHDFIWVGCDEGVVDIYHL